MLPLLPLTTSFRYFPRKLSFARKSLTGRVFFQSLASNSNRYESMNGVMPRQRKEEELSLDFVIDLFKSTSQYSAPKSNKYEEEEEDFVEEEEQGEMGNGNNKASGGVEIYDTILFSEEALQKKKSSEMDYLESGYLFRNENPHSTGSSGSGGLLEEAIMESGSSRSMFHRVASKAVLKKENEAKNEMPPPLTLSRLLQKYISADYFFQEQPAEVEPDTVKAVDIAVDLAELPTECLDYVTTKVLLEATEKENRTSALSLLRKGQNKRNYEFKSDNSDGRFMEIVHVCTKEYKLAMQHLPRDRFLEEDLLWRKIAKVFKQAESRKSDNSKKLMTVNACKRKWEQLRKSAQQE